MVAWLGNALFWICILLAAFWAALAMQNKDDVITYSTFGGIMLLLGMALRYVLNRKEASRRQPSDEHVASVDAPLEAISAYGELTTTLKQISRRLDVIELQVQRLGSHADSVQGERIHLDAATLCSRALGSVPR